VPAWVHGQAPDWAARLLDLAEQPASHVAHWDIRVDNLLRRPDGQMVFLDWGMAARGPAWADPLLARLERVDSAWFDASLAGSPALAEAGDEVVTAFLAGFGTHLAVRSAVAVDVNLPTLNDFRVRESRRILGAVARRTGRLPD
jgi:aminoglycoside phosphotransferase (APT) family kinase protein